jgi:hypothetical protein
MTIKLSEYFENAKGIGVLATTDGAGQVNQAIVVGTFAATAAFVLAKMIG